MSRKYRRYEKEDFKQIEHLLKQKKSWREIGRELRRAHGNVFRAYKRWAASKKKGR